MNQMEEKNNQKPQTGLEILNDFFYNLPDKQIFFKDRFGSNNIDLSWIYTESIPRAIIQKTIARLLQEHSIKAQQNRQSWQPPRKTYYELCDEKRVMKSKEDGINGVNPCSISTLSITATPQRTSLVVLGADGWSKIRITDKIYENEFKEIPCILFEDFEKEICKTIVSEQNPDYTPFLKGIHSLVDDSFRNLVEYYKYLIQQKKVHSTYDIIIDAPDTSTSTPRKSQNKNPNQNPDHPHAPIERKSDIIPIAQRSAFLDDLKPDLYVDVAQKQPDGTIIPRAYTCYVYSRFLNDTQIESKKPGYVLISEPLSGDKYTKVSYVTEEELSEQSKGSTHSQLQQYAIKVLEQNREDFLEQNGILLSHTDLDGFIDKINFYLNGTKGQSITSPGVYLERLRKLYKNQDISLPYYTPRISAKQIGELGNGGTGRVDRSAQRAVELNREKESKEGYDSLRWWNDLIRTYWNITARKDWI